MTTAQRLHSLLRTRPKQVCYLHVWEGATVCSIVLFGGVHQLTVNVK